MAICFQPLAMAACAQSKTVLIVLTENSGTCSFELFFYNSKYDLQKIIRKDS